MTAAGTGDRPRPVFTRCYATISDRMDDEGMGAAYRAAHASDRFGG
jgi:hypothetical protein